MATKTTTNSSKEVSKFGAFSQAQLESNFTKILIFADGFANKAAAQLFFGYLFEYLQRRTALKDSEVLEIIEHLPHDKKDMAMSTYDNILQKGIEKGREKGIEEGILQERIEFTLKLWDNQEFSIAKISMLTGMPQSQVIDIISGHLQEKTGQSAEQCMILINRWL